MSPYQRNIIPLLDMTTVNPVAIKYLCHLVSPVQVQKEYPHNLLSYSEHSMISLAQTAVDHCILVTSIADYKQSTRLAH